MRDYTIFIPEYIAAGAAIGIIGVELFWPNFRKDALAYLTALAAVVWFVAGLFFIGKDAQSFQGLIASDDFTTYFRLLAAGIVFVVSIISANYMSERTKTAAEFYGLMLIGGCAMVYMAAATELITAYISLELLSFSLYILVGYLKRDNLSSEASLKYILLGAFSSAMFLYGMSLVYGVTGTTTYEGIGAALADRSADTDTAVITGFMLIIAGVGFKVSAAPFHMWAPDAYEGAPLPITAFLSTLSKAAGFAMILRLFGTAIVVDAVEWRWAIMVLAAATMTLGNLVAIQQKNLKRLVAYSSIGQVGYMLISIAAIGYGDGAGGVNATSGLLIHIIGYVCSTLLLFVALTAFYNRTRKDNIEDLKGLAETQPFLALVITCALFSFAGLPFFAGFATKLFMFQGATTDETLWVVGLAVVNSFISLYYYLMVIRQMYLFDPVGDQKRWKVDPVLGGLGIALVLGVLFIGMYPGPAFSFSEDAANALFESAPASGVARVP
ncbi:MAG: NADH-quinone oxidoreductase subunit N [Dehalococcoidia bacterium]|jgi:NADH-quinone oxidoreductase subunit N|uniref:NADH-quinone oxidoreductase subunit N n=1 Tax=Candidatus Amarobacter glycogenicus TaxID=3140699 RepID=UPI001DA19380|nr:NADH-quinone oxidoreductase subunit N [Dehalococcoidia bacterium]MBK6562753.1 NADH-quinone oxidoreductase subunit N [Dehalococcoidia bacterium]MBK7126454.1 NADH-quinone oxidoreductase subunit N [Dehalococcoidia bacterium]MBK7725492.1 NADH-quinone oxidoreductase subunit N [Dehalococcoidia bacterium]MBK8560931.1 NADH-quinone oxidoreductase subunit N [Dehalococcoidia bacterium]